MIKKLLNLIYEALGKMVGYKSITDAFELDDSVVSDAMSDSMDLWKSMYKDKSPWLDEHKGVYSLNLAKQICQSFQQQTLSEMETSITEPGVDDETDEDKDDVIDTRAKFLNDISKKISEEAATEVSYFLNSRLGSTHRPPRIIYERMI